MMKRLSQSITALILLTVIPFFHACNRPGEDEHPSISPVSETAFVVGSEGGEVTVTFTASHDWTAAPINDRADTWLTVSPSSGPAGNASVKLVAKENDSVDERNATVRINASTARLDVQLTQKQKNALTVTASKTEFGPEGGLFSIEVKSNVTYEVEMGKDCGWIRQAGTRGLVSTTLNFTVDANEEIQKREGEIIIKGEGLRETVHVYQDGTAPAIVLTADEFTVSDKGEIIQVEVKSNIDVAVSIGRNAASWIDETSTRAMSTSTYYFKIAPNPGYDPRTGTITFTNTESHLSETVTVTQLQKDALIIGGGNVNFGVEGGSFEIQVRHNIDYDFTISADWIRKSTTRSLQEDFLTFMVDTNPTLEQRTGVISFTGQDAGGNDLKTDIEVIQEGEERTLVLSEKEFAVSDKGETIEIQVTTNLELTIEIEKEAEEWIKQTSTRTVTTSSRFFLIDANDGYESRKGVITFSDPASGMSETVTIMQGQKDALVVGDGKVEMGVEGGSFEITVGHNIEFEYSIDVDWIKKVPTRVFFEETLPFIAEANTTPEKRTGKILFVGKDAHGNDLKAEIIVTQEAPSLLVSITGLDVFSQGEVFSFEIESNFEPSVSADDWIVFKGRDHENPHLLLFEAQANTYEEDREGAITFPSQYIQDPPTVTVRQKGTVNGLGYGKVGIYDFSGDNWTFTVGKEQILLSNAGSSLTFTLFNPSDNRFFQTGGLVPDPAVGDVLAAKVTQNLSPMLDAVFDTSLTVDSTDGSFARLSSDKGFSIVVKTR